MKQGYTPVSQEIIGILSQLQEDMEGELDSITKVDWAANKRVEISKFKFKFPRARTYELIRARSRLYRSQSLQVNTRWKALAEIYTMHSFAPLWNRIPKTRKTMGRKEPGPFSWGPSG